MTNPSDTPQIEHPAAEFQGADDLVKPVMDCTTCGFSVCAGGCRRNREVIEQQAKRIEELEAAQHGVVVGAMCAIEGRCLSGEYYEQLAKVQAERDDQKAIALQAMADLHDMEGSIALAREALDKYRGQINRFGVHSAADDLDTTGNAAQAIEARAYEKAIAACEEVGPKEYPPKLMTDGFVQAIRKLAEQKEKGA